MPSVGALLLGSWALGLLVAVIAAFVASTLNSGFGDGVAEPPASSVPSATFDFVTVVQDERSIEAVLKVDLPYEWLEFLHREDTGEKLFSCHREGRECSPRRDVVGDMAMTVEWREGVWRTIGRESVPFADVGGPRGGQFEGPSLTTLSIPVQFPALGRPLHFPDDDYRTEALSVWVEVPENIRSSWEPVGRTGGPFAHRVLDVSDPAGVGDYGAELSPARGADHPAGEWLEVRRNLRVRLVVYAVAAAPLLLVAVAARHWWSTLRTGGTPGLAAVELAAALLAILPLREALVPDGVGGLTRLDYLLSGQVVLIIALVALGSLRQAVPAGGAGGGG
jgi:hypothetical protein